MRKKVLILLFLLMVILLRSETMIVHTTSGDQIFDISDIEQITFDSTGTCIDIVEFLSKVPIQFLKNFPNPFNPVTEIQFELNQGGKVKVEIFNVKGQKVKTILNEYLEQGKHNLIWNGNGENKNRVASGVYFYKVSCNGKEKINKMIMMK